MSEFNVCLAHMKIDTIKAAQNEPSSEEQKVNTPGSASEITADWLKTILKNEPLADSIASIEIDQNFGPISLMGKAVRVKINYTNEQHQPKSVIVKFQRDCKHPKREEGFYRLLSEASVTFIPQVYGTFGNGNLVLEDLSPTHFVVKEKEELTISQIRGVVVKLAELNSKFWDNPPISQLDLSGYINIINIDLGEESWNVFKRRYQAQLEQETAAFEWMRENPETVAKFYKSGTQAMTHGDLHRGNLLFPNNGSNEPIFIDWQQAGQKAPPLDLLYFMIKELTVEQRRAYEHELLKEYYSLLPEHIRATYTFDHLQLSYRACVLQSMQNVVMYVGPRFDNHPGRFEDADRMAERVIAAVQDLKPVEAIHELQERGLLKQ